MANSQQASIRILQMRQQYVQFELHPWAPPLNLFELDHAFVIVAELAGVNPASLQINVRPTLLIIRGVRQLELPQGLRRLHRLEIAAGSFQITTSLDLPVDPDQTTAHYRDGLLEVTLPFARKPGQDRLIIPIQEEGGP